MNRIILSIFIVFAATIVISYAFIDVNILGRVLKSYKDSENYETFADAPSIPFVNMTSAVLVAPEEQTRRVSSTSNSTQCQDSCSYDDNCKGYVFEGINKRCDLLYDITGYVRNKDGLYTTKSGIKLRDYIGERQPDRKYYRLENRELPPDGNGKLVTHQFIKNVNDCKTKCLENNGDGDNKCMAFEYDFKNKSCTLNKQVSGPLPINQNKDAYILIN